MVLSAVVARTPHVGVGVRWIEVMCAPLGGYSMGRDLPAGHIWCYGDQPTAVSLAVTSCGRPLWAAEGITVEKEENSKRGTCSITLRGPASLLRG
jgi:hypothetical protein